MITKPRFSQKQITSLEEDILLTSDFTFQEFPYDGDSGSLYLATSKYDAKEKYIVKHAHCDCACNEYFYSKLGQALGLNTAAVKLFSITDDETYFKTNFVCGIPYLEEAIEVNDQYMIEHREEIENWADYYRFIGMASLCFESDGIEVLRSGNRIYRIDTTSSFSLCLFTIIPAIYTKSGADFLMNSLREKDPNMTISEWQIDLNIFLESVGPEYLDFYLEPFYMIQQVPEQVIEDWITVICSFYPSIIGSYYREYIQHLKIQAQQFILSVTEQYSLVTS